ncbi:hypothetical protein BAU15_00050 [Enterococcus sp. JM4C]|uniref:helix-turn-helix domain-containing protein n=1 Tax=Candidatus Enterococcus huntleyi TaxID=1857217 RepID=UPI00137B15BC|nr:helix-turn-helix domain-containing protein [Enterococcus sp. JM4C]KAF1299073.1 hypothetical protein BAU15_00050 [Enterococcus sp. JM4C]
MNKIETISQLITTNFNIPTSYLETDEFQLLTFGDDFSYNPFYSENLSLILSIDFFDSPIRFPRIRQNEFMENFILFSIFEEDEFKGTLIVGPTISMPLTDEQIFALAKDYQVFHVIGTVMDYYQKMPIYSINLLINLSVLLYYLLNGEVVSSQIIQKDYLQSKKQAPSVKLDTLDYSSKFNLQHDRLFETKILKIVRNGEVENLANHAYFKEEQSQALYSKVSFLRSLKNHLITLAALTSRAAIEGGLHSELALRLCDEYILKIEEGLSREDLYATVAEMLEVFTKMVRENQEADYSTIVKQAIKFVYANLYQSFSHTDIADYVGVSAPYLSKIFKQDTQISLSTFIQKTKVEEAKHLLLQTKISVSDISAALNFTDQSYFTKIFKKITQVTPQHYREKLLDHLD